MLTPAKSCLIVWLLLVTWAGSACSTGDSPAATEVAGQSAAGTQPAAATRYSVGPASIEDRPASLERYRLTTIVDFEGVKAGQASAGRIETLTEVDQPGAAFHQYQTVEATIPSSLSRSKTSEFYRHGNRLYVAHDGETYWFELAPGQEIAPGQLDFFELEQLIVLPDEVATAPTFEKLNGQNVQHFRFTGADLSSDTMNFGQAEGELWVDVAGNFVVQYAISATVTSLVPLPHAHLLDEGRLSIRYALAELEPDFKIGLPVEFRQTPRSLAGIPRLPGGRLTAVYPTLLEYTSVISPISATLFYRDELSTLDWQEESAEIFNEKASLFFSKDADRLRVLINPGSQPDVVNVTLDMDQRQK